MRKDYFKDKVIIVTGASSGIGLASAKLFASLGAKVVMAARSVEKMASEALGFGVSADNILTVKTDVSKEDDCRKLIDRAVEKYGRIDILVNNAGISMRATLRDVQTEVLRSVMGVNFWGTVYCSKYALPYLLASKGSVVGVISIAGYSALPARTAYSAAKFAVRGFLDALRMEHLRDGLHVMIFAPGYTASNVRNAALTADGSSQGETPRDEEKMMTAQECALHLAKGLAARKDRVTLTALGKVTVFMRNTLPSLTDRMTYDFIAKEPGSPFGGKV